MPTVSTTARPASSASSRGPHRAVAAVAVASVLGVLLYLLLGVMAEPSRVDVAIDNPTDFAISVDVRSADGSGTLRLGTVSPRSTKTFTGVIDQGDRWIVELRAGPISGGSIEIERRTLIEQGITVTPDMADRLRDGGAQPHGGG